MNFERDTLARERLYFIVPDVTTCLLSIVSEFRLKSVRKTFVRGRRNFGNAERGRPNRLLDSKVSRQLVESDVHQTSRGARTPSLSRNSYKRIEGNW